MLRFGGVCDYFRHRLGQLRPTTVQLPTFSMFGVDTTVSVPDSGSTYLGGVDRASSDGNQLAARGAVWQPLHRQPAEASSMRVSAYVHDFQAMDEQLLNQPRPSTVD